MYQIDPVTGIHSTKMPNGLGVSADEEMLYVVDICRSRDEGGRHPLLALDVDEDWSVGEPQRFATIEAVCLNQWSTS